MWRGWQASRQALSSCPEMPDSCEPVAYAVYWSDDDVDLCEAPLPSFGEDPESIQPLYTHPASDVPEGWKLVPETLTRALQDSFDIIQADANTEQNYESLCRIGGVLAKLKATPTKADENLQSVANKVCKHIPGNMVLSLCMENGAAWVELGEDKFGSVDLPDSADKSLLEQINDALCVAKGWIDEPPKEQNDE
jgi:hypothetical protein